VTEDAAWMRLAVEEARRGTGLTSPNPCVGAALVKDGALLASGWHRKAGGPHAEVEALRAAELLHGPGCAAGATIYITLEPCSTTGRTGACTEALIAAKIARVVWGADDPNPRHAGRAREILESAGIAVTSGVPAEECQEILAPWAKWITTGLPWVVAKAGLSLDGRITRPAGEGQWLTGEAAREDAMLLRAASDAIIIGAGTLRADDPALTLRGSAIPAGKEQPLRVVLTNSPALPENAQLFTDAHKHRTLVLRGLTLEAALRELAARGVVRVLIEGGGTLLAQAFAADLVDEAVLYLAPLISGTGLPAVNSRAWTGGSRSLVFKEARRTGPDLRLHLRRP
jgi:diaminohydroxyphosphoribosylaminopyrimidine deaminase / 5-amino-6-(5-phosphoribosylamino)uracil reductase